MIRLRKILTEVISFDAVLWISLCSRGFGPTCSINSAVNVIMKVLIDLFSTESGLMSAAVIAFILGMAAWFLVFFRRKMNDDAKNSKA